MTAQQWIALAIQASIMLSVFAFGLACSMGDLLYVLRRPARLLRSLAAMFLIMPVVAIGLVKLFELHHAVQIVLVALALSPVPPLLVKKGTKASGEQSPVMGLLVAMALLSILIVPIGVSLVGPLFDQSFKVPPAAVAAVVAKSVLAPLALGMLARWAMPNAADRVARPAAVIALVVLVVAGLVILYASLPAIRAQLGDGTVFALLAFIVVGIAAGHWLGGPDPGDRAGLALSSASRNPGIAMAMASLNFPGEPGVGATILLYLLLNVVVSLPYVHWQRTRRGG